MAPKRFPGRYRAARIPCTKWPRRALDWLCAGRSDYRDFQQRKRTQVYRVNRSICLATWTGAALLLLMCGSAGCLVVIALSATLVCFVVLDPD